MVSTGRTIERTMLTRTQESSENSSPSTIVHQKEAKPIVIDCQKSIYSVAVLTDGKHIVSGDAGGKIQRWRIENGKQVGAAMNAGGAVLNITVPRDGNVIVGGTNGGLVTVWNAESHSKVTEFRAHRGWVRALDVSPDAWNIATGSDDESAYVWSLETGKRQLGALQHDNWVVAAKFSPNGRLFATATCNHDSVWVYDSQNGSQQAGFLVKVYSSFEKFNHNQPLVWASDNKQLFVLSVDGYIHRVNVSTGTTLQQWHIHSSDRPTCIALAGNGTFIAAAAGSSVSFWDTTSQEQIGTVIEYTHDIWSMAMSANYDLVASGDKRITLQALSDTLPSHYLDNKSGNRTSLYLPLQTCKREMQHTVEEVDDSPSTFMRTLIQVCDIHVHQMEQEQISRKPSRNCATSLPNLNKLIRRGITSSNPYVPNRRARVCPPLP